MILVEDWPDAQEITQKYFCAACWGILKADLVPDTEDSRKIIGYGIECMDCHNVPGFVSHHYVTRRQEESLSQWYEARDALTKAAPWILREMFPEQRHRLNIEKSEAQIMKELGF